MPAPDDPTWPRLLLDHRNPIMSSWLRMTESELGGRITTQELQQDLDEVWAALFDGVASSSVLDVEDSAFAGLRSLLADLGRTRARQGFSPTEAATSVFALKRAVLAVLAESDAADAADGFRAFGELSVFVDSLGLHLLETYAAARETVIAQQGETLLELSTPVVKLWDGIVALPLVGTLDSARTQVVMETLLEALVETGSEHAIIDITGVPAVDTQVAQHLLKTVRAARLLGAECIISGIRPQIAQTVVALGIEFGDIQTKANLADATLLAMRRSGYDVVKR